MSTNDLVLDGELANLEEVVTQEPVAEEPETVTPNQGSESVKKFFTRYISECINHERTEHYRPRINANLEPILPYFGFNANMQVVVNPITKETLIEVLGNYNPELPFLLKETDLGGLLQDSFQVGSNALGRTLGIIDERLDPYRIRSDYEDFDNKMESMVIIPTLSDLCHFMEHGETLRQYLEHAPVEEDEPRFFIHRDNQGHQTIDRKIPHNIFTVTGLKKLVEATGQREIIPLIEEYEGIVGELNSPEPEVRKLLYDRLATYHPELVR